MVDKPFPGRPLSITDVFVRGLVFLVLALLCALMGWLVYA